MAKRKTGIQEAVKLLNHNVYGLWVYFAPSAHYWQPTAADKARP